MAARNQRAWIVPGFHLPLKWQQEGGSGRSIHRDFLDSALDGSENGGDGFRPITVDERSMLSLMNQLTDDPHWVQLITDSSFVEGWKHRTLSEYARITQQMVDWCVQEVQDRAVRFQATQYMRALDHGVYKSDTIIKPALNIALRCSLARLERVSRHDKNPNPENTQNFIVDPGLYPWRFGVTKYYSSPLPRFEDCIRLSGRGISRNLLLPRINGSLNERWSYKIENAWSLVYQCLPCDISFEEETGKPRITSYINNVHPVRDQDFYAVSNELLSAFIPMLNSTLMHVKTPQLFNPRIDPEKRISHKNLPDPEPGPYRSCESRITSVHLTADGELPTHVRVDLQKEFWDIGIQAIIQVSSIDLDEERPNFPGEEWHVQGLLNERICASVVYCYDCDNISEASISFRHRCSTEDLMSLNTLTRTTKETEDIYGVEDLKPAVQEQGSVSIRKGRAISFPNVMQTKLNPIKLRHPAKAGHLKLFTVHLIDPNRRIMSTSMVPCQRRDWWGREIRQKVPVLRRLPLEIFNHIIDMIGDFPISAVQARNMKEEMMRERVEFTEQHTEAMLSQKFSLMTDARRYDHGRCDDDEEGD